MRAERRVRVVSSQIGRCDHELKALRVGGRRAVTLVHVAAANPLRTRRNSHLIASPIVAHSRACRMSAVTVVITRLDRVGAAGATAGVNRIVPVKVVIGGGAVPAPILWLKGVMGPALACVLVTHYDPLTGKA